MIGVFRSRETYRVHGAAHPASIKARALEIRLMRLAIQERAISRKPAESLGPERETAGGTGKSARKAGGRLSGDSAIPPLEWRGKRVYVAGQSTGYETLAEALEAWRAA